MSRESVRRGLGWAGKGIVSSAVLLLLIVVVGAPRASHVMDLGAATRPVFAALAPLAGSTLVLAGIAAWWTVRPRVIGPAAVVAGFAWLAPGIVEQSTASDLARSLALPGGPLLLPAVALLLTGAWRVMTGRFPAGLAWLVRGLVLAAIGLTVVRVVTYDPSVDPVCARSCTMRNALLLPGEPATTLYRVATAVWSLLSVAAWLLLATWCVRRGRGLGGREDPTRVRGILAAGAVLGVASATWAAGIWLQSAVPPLREAEPLLAVAWSVQALALTALAAGVGRLAVARLRRALAIRAALDALSAIPGPGGLQAGLAAALDDPALRVRYRLDDGRWVDGGGVADGPLEAVPGRALTTIERAGVALAAIDHVAVEDPALVRGIGAAARLGVDNERLRAGILASIADLRASRARIVAAADGERRRLERDLHDGAQQRLLALSYEIRVALAGARARQASAVAIGPLERADALARTAITDLRRLAHGIHPAILGDTGLAPALASLADDAPIPVELDVRSRERCAEPVELAAYHLVADSLERATRAGASHLAVQIDREHGLLRVSLADDGPGSMVGVGRGGQGGVGAGVLGAEELRSADRVGALGGRLLAGAGPAGIGRRLVAELPCA